MLNSYFMVVKGLLGPANLLEMNTITSLLTTILFLLCIMESIITKTYETNFGTAYEHTNRL